MTRMFPGVPWCRYADDGQVHCKTETEALTIKAALKGLLMECGLEMHPDKTHIVYARTEVARKSTRTDLSLRDISRLHNPVPRGWVAYYGKFHPSAMCPVFRHFNNTLVAWAMRKYKRLKGHKTRASLFLEKVAEKQPRLFVHWRNGTVGSFA